MFCLGWSQIENRGFPNYISPLSSVRYQISDLINSKDIDGWTPLLWPAKKGGKEVVKLLLGMGADINAKTKDGRTPFSVATDNRHTAVVKLLEGMKSEPREAF